MSRSIDRCALIEALATGEPLDACARALGVPPSTLRREIERERLERTVTASGAIVVTTRGARMQRLPENIARLLPDGHSLVIEDLTIAQARAVIGAASDEIERGRQMIAAVVPHDWRAAAPCWSAIVDWLGGAEALQRLRLESNRPNGR